MYAITWVYAPELPRQRSELSQQSPITNPQPITNNHMSADPSPRPSALESNRSGTVQLGAGVTIPAARLHYAFSRSGGPGGQAVNKLSTRAELRVAVKDIDGLTEHAAARLRRLAGRRLTQNDQIVLHAQTSRSQLDNKVECLARLRAMVEQALIVPKVRKKRKPTRSMVERRLVSKRRASEKKQLRRSRRDRSRWD
jgi:ribosome-associated protein